MSSDEHEQDQEPEEPIESIERRQSEEEGAEGEMRNQFVYRHLPVLTWLKQYNVKLYLASDLLAGFTIGIMNIPQGMAYALLATLTPVNGLYMSFFPLLIYAFFGTSRHLAIGAIAIISLLSGSVIDRMTTGKFNETLVLTSPSVSFVSSEEEKAYRVRVACSLAILVGFTQLLLGLSGLGFVTSYLSDSFISSYTTGSAIHVLVSQIKDLFGLKNVIRYSGLFKIPKSIIDLASKFSSLNLWTMLVSFVAIIHLILFKQIFNPQCKKRYGIEIPSELILVIIMTSLSYAFDFAEVFHIDIVNTIPRGLPSPQIPNSSLFLPLLKDALIIALVSFSINISLATLFARKNSYSIDSTQELYAYGLSNVFASFFSCFPCAASLSRSSVLESSNSKTQLASLSSSLIILVVILWLGPLFGSLPKACLASIIVVALKTILSQIQDLYFLWSRNKYDFFAWLITFLGVILLDVDIGLVVGVAVFVLNSFIQKNLIRYHQLDATTTTTSTASDYQQ